LKNFQARIELAAERFGLIVGLLKNGHIRKNFDYRLTVTLGVTAVFVLIVYGLHAFLGEMVFWALLFPVLSAGWLLGAVGGVIYGLLATVLDRLLAMGLEASQRPFASGFIDGLHVFLIVFLGLAAGWVGDWHRKRHPERLNHSLSENRYRGIFDHANDINLILYQGVIIDCNQRALDLFGVQRGEILGLTPSDFSPLYQPDGSRSAEKLHEKVAVALVGEPQRFEWQHQRVDGETFMVEVSLNRLDFPSGPHILAALRDITERKRSEQVQAAIYRISEAANSSIGLQELYATIHAILNELMAAENMFIALYDAEKDLITFPYFVDQYDPVPEPRRSSAGLTEFVLHTQQPQLVSPERFDSLVEQGLVTSIGTPSVDWLGVPLKVEDQIIGVLGTQTYQPGVRFGKQERDIVSFVSDQIAMAVHRKRGEERLKYLSIHDPLTGLYNRAYFEDELARLERGRKFPVSVLVADLDGLKNINDQLGHAAGDQALRQAGRLLQRAFRSEDGLARIGGDEFAVLLPGVGRSEAGEVMARVRDLLEEYNRANTGPLLSISLGIATCEACSPVDARPGGRGSTAQPQSLNEAMRLADERMYQDKKRRKHVEPQ
jgi:diguanylate cyclase (GGDEF)-like protein/PAS domain S-box-containing protein